MQSSRNKITAAELVDQSVENMKNLNLLVIGQDEKMEVTKLGKATLKGVVDLDKSKQLYDDLRLAQAGLVLMTKLHLMYLVTPYELVGSVHPIASTYFQVNFSAANMIVLYVHIVMRSFIIQGL